MSQIDHPDTNRHRIPVNYEYSPAFPQILSHLNASILCSTYQAGKVLALGTNSGKLTISWLELDQPMGLAFDGGRLAIGSRRQVQFFSSAHETLQSGSEHDSCFVARSSVYSGAVHGHELGWGNEGLWVVNTLFSCLCTLHPQYSFVPQWQPPFISKLIDEDRCHLNGMAMFEGRPRYVTVLGETDSAGGWRSNKVLGGALLEVPSGRVVCRGLAMPHSPRVYQSQLLVLNSGRGELCSVAPQNGGLTTIESMPGYTRGLVLAGPFAFVGLSKIRETAIFGGLPIGEHPERLCCGIGIVDLIQGKTVATFQFHSGVEEIFALEILPGCRHPLLSGSSVNEKQHEVWIVPSEQGPRPRLIAEPPIYSGNVLSPNVEIVEDKIDAIEPLLKTAQTLRQEGALQESAKHLERAAAISPNPCNILIELGNLRQDQGDQQAARLCYERALHCDPQSMVARQNLGYLLFNCGLTDEAASLLDELVNQHPTPLNHLLSASVSPVVYDSQADIDYWQARTLKYLKAAAGFGEKLDATQMLVPTFFFSAYSGLCPKETMELRGKLVQGRDFTTGSGPRNARSTERPRVGFLSAYFREHTIGRLNIGRFEATRNCDLEKIVIYAGTSEDAYVDRFRRASDKFVTLPRDLSAAIRSLQSLELDGLVFADVGMDTLTTTLAFSRFAPLQLCTWGHPMTTGSPMMDYFISSRDIETSNASKNYTESLLQWETLGLCYHRPELATKIVPSDRARFRERFGLTGDKHLYGCPQTLFKFHPDMDDTFFEILSTDSKAKILLLQSSKLRWTTDLQRRLRRTLSVHSHRVHFLPALPNEDFLKLLAACDVILDPFPFGGGNTTLEALAMGTPVVTYPSEQLSGKLTAAFLRRVGLSECIATDKKSYAKKAFEIAAQPENRLRLTAQIISNEANLFHDEKSAYAWFAAIRNLILSQSE